MVSFDLYVFPPSGPQTVDGVRSLMEVEEERLLAGESECAPSDPAVAQRLAELDTLPAPGPGMAQFLDELERRWPTLESDLDGSPWASSPLWQPMIGGGTGLNIVWSQADAMGGALIAIARLCNVIVYDPQSDEVVLPMASPPKRSWFKRQGR